MIPTAVSPAPTLQALVVEPNEDIRRMLAQMLRDRGCEVLACGDLAQARMLFREQRLVFAPLNGDNSRMKEFVAWVRARAGTSQPWIIALGLEHCPTPGETPGDYGVNDLIAGPVEISTLVARLESLGLGKSAPAHQPVQPQVAPATQTVEPPKEPEVSSWDRATCEVLLENFPAAVAIVDRSLNYLCANRRWMRDFQLGGNSLNGRNHLDVFPDLHPGWRDLYAHCLEGNSRRSEDDMTVRPDGTREWLRWEIHPWRGAGEGVGGLVLTCAVVKTEPKSPPVEEAPPPPVQEELPEGPPEETPPPPAPRVPEAALPMVELNREGVILFANTAAAALAGGGEVVGRPYWEALASPEERESVQRSVTVLAGQASTADGVWHSQDMEEALTREPGAPSRILWSSFPRRSADGSVDGLVRIGQACEEAPPEPAPAPAPVVMERAPEPEPAPPPRPSEEDTGFRQMAEAAPFGMILLNEDADVLYANPQHRAVLGFSVEECGGMELWLGRGCSADEDYQKRAVAEWWERVWRRRAPWTCSMRNAEGLLKEVEFRPASLPGHRLLLTVFDVTDARLEEQAVRASEARYRGLFQQCAAAVVILNNAGNIIEINPVFERLTGSSRLSLRRASLGDFLPEEAVAKVRHLAASAETGVELPHPEVLTTLSGHSGRAVPVALSIAVVKNEQGHTAFTACYLHPLAVGLSTLLSRPATPPAPEPAAEEVSPDLVTVLDNTGTILSHKIGRDFPAANIQKSELSGILFEAAFPDLSAPLPVDVMMEQLLDHPASEVRCDFEAPLEAQGEVRNFEARMIRLPEEEGNAERPTRFGLIIRDVTAAIGDGRPGAVEAHGNPGDQPAGELSLPALLRHAQTAAVITDDRGRVTFLNPAACELTGHTAGELEGQGLYRIFRPGDPEGFSAELSARLREERRWCAVTSYIRADGSAAQGEIDLSPTVDERTGQRGFVALLRPHTPPVVKASVSLHRARNDLQVLSSLLALQPDSPSSVGRDRVAAMALIYRLISSETDPVDFSRFSRELSRLLLDNRGIRSTRLVVETCFEETRLPQRASVPLALILQELLCARLDKPIPDTVEAIRLTVHLTMDGAVGRLKLAGPGVSAALASQSDNPGGKILELLAERILGKFTTGEASPGGELEFRFECVP